MKSPLDRHQKIALSFSGGKDSLACVYLLRHLKDRIRIYHMDTGDLLPEIEEVVEHVKSFWPDFVHVRGDVNGWIRDKGMPTDLLPYTAHFLGKGTGETEIDLVPRYDCCFANLMWPIYQRIKDDGYTLIVRGTKRADTKKMMHGSGVVADGVELLHPIEDWSHEDVFAYLRGVGAPIPRIYTHVTNSPECARCPAWWNEKRASYLRQYYPEIWRDYAARMRIVAAEIALPLANFQREMADCEDAP